MALTPDQLARISTRLAAPDAIEKGLAQRLELPLYMDGALVVPALPTTLEILDAAKGEDDPVLVATAATIADGVAHYDLPAATTADLDYASGWMEVWRATIEGSILEFRREAELVRTRLRPVISYLDLARMHTELRDWLAQDPAAVALQYQGYIDAAWDEIQVRLMEQGNRPNLILSNYSLRTVHLDKTLEMVFLDYASSASRDGKYLETSNHYGRKYTSNWKRIQFRYDFNEDGLPAEPKQNASPVLMTCGPPAWRDLS